MLCWVLDTLVFQILPQVEKHLTKYMGHASLPQVWIALQLVVCASIQFSGRLVSFGQRGQQLACRKYKMTRPSSQNSGQLFCHGWNGQQLQASAENQKDRNVRNLQKDRNNFACAQSKPKQFCWWKKLLWMQSLLTSLPPQWKVACFPLCIPCTH